MTTASGTKFVVLTAQRSGSTWFIEVVNNFVDATVCAELFLPRKKPRDQRLMSWKTAEHLDNNLRNYPLFCEAALSGFTVRPFSVLAYLNQLYRTPGTIGFKCMYSNLLRYPELWTYIVLNRLHVVHLVRRNHFDVVISDRIRLATQTVHRIVDEPEVAQPQIELDPAEIVKLMRRFRRNINIARLLLRVFGLPCIEVAYEVLVQDPQHFDDVCEFLSINRERRPPQSKLAKLVKGNHSEIIRNYGEVKCALMATEFASLLD